MPRVLDVEHYAKRSDGITTLQEEELLDAVHLVAERQASNTLAELIPEHIPNQKLASNFSADACLFRKEHQCHAENTVQAREKRHDLLPWRACLFEHVAYPMADNVIPNVDSGHTLADFDSTASLPGYAFEKSLGGDHVGRPELKQARG